MEIVVYKNALAMKILKGAFPKTCLKHFQREILFGSVFRYTAYNTVIQNSYIILHCMIG